VVYTSLPSLLEYAAEKNFTTATTDGASVCM